MRTHRAGRRAVAKSEIGFTLIELPVVVVIIGILIAIALYLNYKKGANGKAAQSDLRGAVHVLEQCNADNSAGYPSAVSAAGALTGCTLAVKLSSGTTIAYYPKSATDLTGYIVSMTNSGGSGKIYCYNSTVAGSVTSTSTAVIGYRASC